MLRISIFSIAMLAIGAQQATAQYFPSAASQRRAAERSREHYNRALETGKGLRMLHSADVTFGITLPHQGIFKIEDGTLATHPTMPDSVIKQEFTFKTKVALSASALTQFDFIKINRNNAFAFVWGGNAHINMDAPISEDMKVLNGSYLAKFKHSRLMIAIPLGFSFKTGGFASHDKADRVSFAMGATLVPTFHNVTLTRNGSQYYEQTNIYVQPYYFAELGIFGGMKWKIRAGIYPRGYEAINKDINGGFQDVNSNEYRHIEYKSKGPLVQLTLGLMNGSNDWQNSRW